VVLDILRKEKNYSDKLATRRIRFGLKPVPQHCPHTLNTEYFKALIE
jgi:hypothetical protein